MKYHIFFNIFYKNNLLRIIHSTFSQLCKVKQLCCDLKINKHCKNQTNVNDHKQLSSILLITQNYIPASHTTNGVCTNIIHKWRQLWFLTQLRIKYFRVIFNFNFNFIYITLANIPCKNKIKNIISSAISSQQISDKNSKSTRK